MDGLYETEPRLRSLEALIAAVARREGIVPWDDVQVLLRAFLGVRRDASVVAPATAVVQATMPRLRDEAVLAVVGHRLRDLAASMDGGHPAGQI